MGNCAQQEAVGEIAVRQKVAEKSVDILVARADDLKKTVDSMICEEPSMVWELKMRLRNDFTDTFPPAARQEISIILDTNAHPEPIVLQDDEKFLEATETSKYITLINVVNGALVKINSKCKFSVRTLSLDESTMKWVALFVGSKQRFIWPVYPEEDPLHGSEATVENMEVSRIMAQVNEYLKDDVDWDGGSVEDVSAQCFLDIDNDLNFNREDKINETEPYDEPDPEDTKVFNFIAICSNGAVQYDFASYKNKPETYWSGKDCTTIEMGPNGPVPLPLPF